MPQASEELRDLFFEYDNEGNLTDGGIIKAEKVVESAGGTVSANGTIIYDGEDQDAWNAIKFLCNEWDYGLI